MSESAGSDSIRSLDGFTLQAETFLAAFMT